jgi:hypothetical protein
MTANVPFTPAVIAYDPPRQYVLGVIPAPGSVLDILTQQFKQTSSLIYRANQQKLYTNVSPVTIFVSMSFVFDPNTPVSDAVQMCRSITVPRRLNRTALRYSSTYLLRTLSSPFDILVQNNGQTTTINHVPIIDSIECTNGVIHIIE